MSALDHVNQRRNEALSRSPRLKLDPRLRWFLVTAALICAIDLVSFGERVPYLWWRYLHIVSGACFFGVVLISSVIEELVARTQDLRLIGLYHELVITLDQRVVTVSVSSLLLSAIALMQARGHHLRDALVWPLWAQGALLLLMSLGLVWALVDLRSQARLSELLTPHVTPEHSTPDTALRAHLLRRRWVNVISVLVTLGIYVLMVFKPS